MKVSVVYAGFTEKKVYYLKLKKTLTVQEVIQKSGVLNDFLDINLSCQTVGIYGETVQMSDIVCNNDRIEIYRPLLIDPKIARTIRAERKRQKQNLNKNM